MHLSSTLFLLPLLPLAHAWGVVGHEIVATIAQIHLFPETKSAIRLLIPTSGHLAPVAAWADRVSTYHSHSRWSRAGLRGRVE